MQSYLVFSMMAVCPSDSQEIPERVVRMEAIPSAFGFLLLCLNKGTKPLLTIICLWRKYNEKSMVRE